MKEKSKWVNPLSEYRKLSDEQKEASKAYVDWMLVTLKDPYFTSGLTVKEIQTARAAFVSLHYKGKIGKAINPDLIEFTKRNN